MLSAVISTRLVVYVSVLLCFNALTLFRCVQGKQNVLIMNVSSGNLSQHVFAHNARLSRRSLPLSSI